ncbi:hypothetical protein CCB80_11220 [Armatimonadetes bacterium Uphvl-Ar1]|nr:hypothetical protein CCB80_11220 [Armatimonadetes bacterium Uphvl-Ar1]
MSARACPGLDPGTLEGETRLKPQPQKLFLPTLLGRPEGRDGEINLDLALTQNSPPSPLGEDLGGGRQDTSKINPENPPEPASANTGSHFWNHLTPNLRSEPSTHGAIQITPDNQLLIHGPDGPTLGGYPKIGTIIEADLPTLAQLRPGQPIQLTPISLEGALDLRQESALQLQKTLLQINQALRIAHNST